MITIKTEDKEFSCPTSWDELKCRQYIQLLELEAKRESFIVDFMYTQRFLEILCGVSEGDLDDVTVNQLADIEPIIRDGFNQEGLADIKATTDHFVINGITYSFYTRDGLMNITLAEQAYIEQLKASGSLFDSVIKAVAVMMRPATLITTKEGESYYKMDKFQAGEVAHRANIIADNMTTKDLVMMNNFFLTGATT